MNRWLYCWAVTGALVMAGSSGASEVRTAEQLLNLDGQELINAADEAAPNLSSSPDYTTKQLAGIAGKLARLVKPIGESSSDEKDPFGDFFEAACDKAGDDDLAALIDAYSCLDPGSFDKTYYLPNLAAVWIRRELRHCDKKAERPHIDLAKIEVPQELTGTPEELVRVWRIYKANMLGFEKAFPPLERRDQISYEANERTFFKTIEAVLAGKTDGAARALMQFATTPGMNCMGTHEFEDSQAIGMLMILLREKRATEAVGAALLAERGNRPLICGQDKFSAIIETLKTLGVDWESAVAGGLVDYYANHGMGDSKSFLRLLGGYGSDRAALLVTEVARWAKPQDTLPLIAALGAFVDDANAIEGEEDGGVVRITTDDIERIVKRRPAKKVQAQCLQGIEDLVSDDLRSYAAMAALSIFHRTRSPSSIPVLRRLATSPDSAIANEAVQELRRLGETVAPTENLNPVQFQVRINGKPLPAGSKVDWNVTNGKGGYVSDLVEVKPDGIVEVDRKHFRDPEHPAASLVFGTPLNNTDVNSPLFEHEIPPPSDLDGITVVNVTTHQLILNITNLQRLGSRIGKTGQLTVSPPGTDDTFSKFHSPTKFQIPVSDSIVVPAVQPGSYKVTLEVPGAETWSEEVTIGPESKPLSVPLQPGSDVHVKIVSPGNRRYFTPELIKDGAIIERYTDESNTFRGLPFGNYVLHIPNSDETERSPLEEEIKKGPDEVSYAGRDVSFVIGRFTPAELDLGEIRLDPLPQAAPEK